jgi:hypothetical protein
MILKFFKFKTKIDLVNTDIVCWRGSVAEWQGCRGQGPGGRVAGWQGGRVAGCQGVRVVGWQGGRGQGEGGRGLGI